MFKKNIEPQFLLKTNQEKVERNCSRKENGNAVLGQSNLHDITNQFNEERDQTFSCRTIHRHLRKNGYRSRVVKNKIVVRSEKKNKTCCVVKGEKTLDVDQH